MSDSDIAGDSASSSLVAGDVDRLGVCREPPARERGQRGLPYRVVLIFASLGGWWCGAFDRPAPPAWRVDDPRGNVVLVGAILASASLEAATSEPTSVHHAGMRALADRLTSSSHCHGYLEYTVKAVVQLCEIVLTNPRERAASLLQRFGREVITYEGGIFDSAVHTLGDAIEKWVGAGALLVQPVRLSPSFAAEVVLGGNPCLHAVQITAKTDRKRLLAAKDLSRRRLKVFVDTNVAMPIQRLERTVPIREARPKWRYFHDASLVIDWLASSVYIKDVKQIGNAAESFATLLSRSGVASKMDLLAGLQKVAPEILRRARTRFDISTMLMYRSMFADLFRRGDEVFFYLFADASPQWRGVDMFGATIDIYHAKAFTRKLLPIVSLSRSRMDSLGKLFTLLWQCYLLIGPSLDVFRWFLMRVKAITTDFGTERKLARFRDMLPDFGWLIKHVGWTRAHRERWMFPYCIQVPGWKHQFDLFIRRGLGDLSFFPGWLAKLKAIVSFLRLESNVNVLKKSFEASGAFGLSDMISMAKLPRFADWRWGTLQQCTKILTRFIDSFIRFFNVRLFAGSRDNVQLTLVASALSPASLWRRQLDFVTIFCDHLGTLMQWGVGCRCHSSELAGGAVVDCVYKGRRLPEAYEHSMRELRAFLALSATWTEATFGCGAAQWLEMQGSVRATFHLACEKLEFLNRLPYSLVRLLRPGGRDRLLEEFAAHPENEHHPLTLHFLSTRGPLRAYVDALAPDGTGATPELIAELDALCQVPMDDSAAEGPHAVAKRISVHARSCSWAWVASTMRLKQNLSDYQELRPCLDTDFEALWQRPSSILQTSLALSKRAKRMTGKKLRSWVYAMAFCDDDMGDDEPPWLDGAGGGDEPPDDPGDPGAPRGPPHGGDDAGDDDEEDDDPPGGDAGDPCGEAHESVDRTDEDIKLLRQYLAACLDVYSFVSVPVVGEDDAVFAKFFQVLSRETKNIVVDTLGEKEEPALFRIAVQPFERWRARSTDPAALSLEEEVYIFDEPVSVDVLRVCGHRRSNREHWFRWDGRSSDVEGCLSMTNSRRLSPTMPLSSPSVPVLSLLDELGRQGWEGLPARALHSPDSPNIFDCRSQLSKRSYFQCLLALDDIWKKGNESFPSGEPSVFYVLLLKAKGAVPLHLGATAYKRELAQLTGDDAALTMLALPAPKPVELAVKRPRSEDSGSDVEVAGDDARGPEESAAACGSTDVKAEGPNSDDGVAAPESDDEVAHRKLGSLCMWPVACISLPHLSFCACSVYVESRLGRTSL